MKKTISMIFVLFMFFPFISVAQIGFPISVEITTTCPYFCGDVDYELKADVNEIYIDIANSTELIERNYLFTGEQIFLRFDIIDLRGIYSGCVMPVVTINSLPQAGCKRESVSNVVVNGKIIANGKATYNCTYTVEPNAHGKSTVGIEVTDKCVSSCSNEEIVIDELYLNPIISLNIDSSQTLNMLYDENRNVLTAIYAGNTVYSPDFVISSTTEPGVNVRLVMKTYATSLRDTTTPNAICPTSSTLSYSNIEYEAKRNSIQTNWKQTYPITSPGYLFPELKDNILLPGESMVIRTRINIPIPCEGVFNTGGSIMFIGEVI